MRTVIWMTPWGAKERGKGSLLVWIGLSLLLAVPVAIWWWLRTQEEEGIPASHLPPMPRIARPQTTEPDDLTRIEGIGPKVQACLRSAGITTFAGLAAKTSTQLKGILRQAGVYMANPQTWPEQAKLAARGE